MYCSVCMLEMSEIICNRLPEMLASKTNHQILKMLQCLCQVLCVWDAMSPLPEKWRRRSGDGKVHTWKDLEDRGQSWTSASSHFWTQGFKALRYKLRWLFGSVLRLNIPVSLSRWKKGKQEVGKSLLLLFIFAWQRIVHYCLLLVVVEEEEKFQADHLLVQ